MGTICWHWAFLLPSITRSLDRHLWHWWSELGRSWCIRIQMISNGTRSKYQTTTCRLLAHSNISTSTSPFTHAFHRFDHEKLFDLWSYHTCCDYALASWNLLSWQKSWVPYLRVRDQDDHVKICGATITTCQEAVVSCQWLSLRVSTSAAAHPAQEAGAHFFCFS